ncbi:MAG: SGNH/GDSL hydrolase family protein [Gemmatimonadota bacterium]|nr:SGNH/GDSL hydrolase family protein [Gemmatimonadota bacterium]
MSIRPWLVNGSLAVAVLLASLAVAEVALRLVFPGPQPEAASPGYFQHDTLLGWSKRPGAEAQIETSEYSVRLQINGQGLRGPEYALEKPAGARRVLVLGDSFVEGYTVQAAETVTQVLESLLIQQTGLPVEALNAGTAGYSTDQELLYYERDGRRFGADVTVLCVYVNDIWFNGRGSYWRGYKPHFVLTDSGLSLRGVPVPVRDTLANPFEVEGGRGLVGMVRRTDAWLGMRSTGYRLLRTTVRDSPALSGLSIRLGFGAVPGEFRPWQVDAEGDLQLAWTVTGELLTALRAHVERDGGRLLVFWIPSRPVVYPEDWRQTSRKYAMGAGWNPEQDGVVLKGICAARGLDCIIEPDAFRVKAAELAPLGRHLYFPRDGHWTADGHRLAAELIAARIAPYLNTDAESTP